MNNDKPSHSRLTEFFLKFQDLKYIPETIPEDRIEQLEMLVAYLFISSQENTKLMKELNAACSSISKLGLKTAEHITQITESDIKELKDAQQKLKEFIEAPSRIQPNISIVNQIDLQHSRLQNEIVPNQTIKTNLNWIDKISNLFKHPFILEAWKFLLLALFLFGMSVIVGQQAAIQQVQKMLPISTSMLQHAKALTKPPRKSAN
jgi:hypothetical protein